MQLITELLKQLTGHLVIHMNGTVIINRIAQKNPSFTYLGFRDVAK
jgi:hypothetical protein